MSLAFHARHAERSRALMLFDTGPGFTKDDAREAWNARARTRADDLDARGLAAHRPQRRGAPGAGIVTRPAQPARRAACSHNATTP